MSTSPLVNPSPASAGEPHSPVHESGRIDYFTGTHRDVDFLRSLQTGSLEKSANRYGGYANAFTDRDGVTVSWGHPFTSSAQISLGGAALEALRRQGREQEVFLVLADHEVKVTRLDLARDTSGILTPQYLARAALRGLVGTRFDELVPHRHISDPNAWVDAGRRGGNSYFHVYRKDLALQAKGVDPGISPLTRWEIQLGSANAAGVFHDLVTRLQILPLTDHGSQEPAFLLANRELSKRITIFATREDREKGWQGRLAKNWARFIEMKAPRFDGTGPEAGDEDPAQAWVNRIGWFLKSGSPFLHQILLTGGAEAVLACAQAGSGRGSVIAKAFPQDHPEEAKRLLLSVLAEHLTRIRGGGR